jgi:sugar/nucleoside kinase (ribokinase family)
MIRKLFDAALFGPAFVDHILTGFLDWPRPGQEAVARGYRREAGGGCLNTACGLAKLGRSAAAFAVIGEDNGPWLTQRLRDFGVATGEIRLSHQPTGVTVSVSMPSDRSFFTFEGANAGLLPWLEEPSLIDRLSAARHVHFALPLAPSPGLQIIRELHARGCTVSLDVGWAPDWLCNRGSFDMLRQVDLFLPNEAEARAITGKASLPDILECFRGIGAKVVALKLGGEGACLLANGEYFEAEPLAVRALDTTGAGDAFNAGFLDAFLHRQPLTACLQRGVICGSLSVRDAGSLTSFPSLEEVNQLQCLVPHNVRPL